MKKKRKFAYVRQFNWIGLKKKEKKHLRNFILSKNFILTFILSSPQNIWLLVDDVFNLKVSADQAIQNINVIL